MAMVRDMKRSHWWQRQVCYFMFTHMQAFLQVRFFYPVLQKDMHSLNFVRYCYIILHKGFANLHFQHCMPHSCFLMYLQMLHVNHLFPFLPICWAKIFKLAFLHRNNVAEFTLICLKKLCGVLLWCSRLRIWHCHWASSGSIPGLGTSTQHGHSQEEKKNKQKKERGISAFVNCLFTYFVHLFFFFFPLFMAAPTAYRSFQAGGRIGSCSCNATATAMARSEHHLQLMLQLKVLPDPSHAEGGWGWKLHPHGY